MQWYADWGTKTPCCQHADEAEIRANPRRYNCETCETQARLSGLWIENLEAWRIYRQLQGRVVQDTGYQALWLDRLLADRTVTEAERMLARLDVILSILSPLPAAGVTSHGRPPTEDRHHGR